MTEAVSTDVGRFINPVERFFAYARERHAIYLRRMVRHEPQPWTDDVILAKYRFTNVYRELDRTTLWCRQYVRDPLATKPELLLAVVLFRWFNRISTGETLFCQTSLLTKRTAFEQMLGLLDKGRGGEMAMHPLRSALRMQPPPHVTGSYTINTPGGMSKTDGVLAQLAAFCDRDWRTRAEQMMVPQFNHTIEGTCIWLEESLGMGGFMAYEVACDLRYTPLLAGAADANTWANTGPGAARGVRRVIDGVSEIDDVRRSVPKARALTAMQTLLAWSRDPLHWPRDWSAWEMREVEHTLCEFDKYERVRLGQGRPRGVFDKSAALVTAEPEGE